MSKLPCCFLVILITLSLPLKGENALKIGKQKQLLFDNYIIEETQNLTLEVGQATKHGVVMEPTLPTDFQTGKVHDGPDGGAGYEFGESCFCWFFSPHWDEDRKKFRLWYMSSKRPGSGIAYAESIDGIKWTKPIISKNGKSNLINWKERLPILRQNKKRDLLDLGVDGITVTIDPSLPFGHKEKYKIAFYPNMGGQDGRTRLGYSSDGINWSFYNEGYPVTGRAADTNNQIHWNPITKKYLLHCRQDFAAGGGVGELRGVRIMEHTKENDLMNHPKAWKTLKTFTLEDPDKSVIDGTNIPVYQIHTFPMWYYEGIWFALTDILAATNRPVPEGEQDFHTRHENGVWEFYMSPSRDAVNYDFSLAAYPRKPLIPRGGDGAFDKDCARPPSNIITKNNEHWIYYLATNERWGARKWDARLALAKLRLDGFFFLKAKNEEGTIITKPFVFDGESLEVNTSSLNGYIKIEMLDQDGNTVASSKTYRGYDNIRLNPEWNERNSLKQFKGENIRLKFILMNSKIFSFKVN